jgi:hypothetical protein
LEEIEGLDHHCPNLTSLELDINPNGTWVSHKFCPVRTTTLKTNKKLSSQTTRWRL